MLSELSPPNWQPASSIAPLPIASVRPLSRDALPPQCFTLVIRRHQPQQAQDQAQVRLRAPARGRLLFRVRARVHPAAGSANSASRRAGSAGASHPGCSATAGTAPASPTWLRSGGVVLDLTLVGGDAVDRVEQHRWVVHRDAAQYRPHPLPADLGAFVVVRVGADVEGATADELRRVARSWAVTADHRRCPGPGCRCCRSSPGRWA